MYPTQLHSYLLWRSSVRPDAQTLASGRFTATTSLLPAAMVGIFVFGWWAGVVVLLSMAAALVTDSALHRLAHWVYSEHVGVGGLREPLWRRVAKHLLPSGSRDSSGTRDGLWLLTGLLLGLLTPPNVPWCFPVLGAALAVLVGKYCLSVDSMPLLQPAAVGLLLLHLTGFAWPAANPMQAQYAGEPRWPVLVRGVEPGALAEPRLSWSAKCVGLLKDFFGGDVRKSVGRGEYRDAVFAGRIPLSGKTHEMPAEAVHGPRPIDLVKANPGVAIDSGVKLAARRDSLERLEDGSDWVALVLGYVPATVGGSSALALCLGILLLVFTGAASPLIPAFALATMFAALHFFAWLSGSYVVPENIPIHLLTGSTLLGLFYLAADPTTAPRSFFGKVYAGIAVGLLEVVLRVFTPLGEGLFISVVVVQGFSFVFDQWLAPPGEEAASGAVGISSTSLGRL